MHNSTSLSISWLAEMVNAQLNLAFDLVARRNGLRTTQPRFRSRDQPKWSMHNPTSISVAKPVVTYLLKNGLYITKLSNLWDYLISKVKPKVLRLGKKVKFTAQLKHKRSKVYGKVWGDVEEQVFI